MGIASLALGQLTYGVSIRELTDAYTAFARDGIYKKGHTYQGVFDYEGNLLISPESIEKRIYKTETARIMNLLLSGVVDNGTAKSLKLKHYVDTAGKTGTSSNNYDRLFVGYTPYFTAGIWSGYPARNNTVNGISPSHLSIWDEIMTSIHLQCAFNFYGEPDVFNTQGLLKLPYCKDSGESPSELCDCDLRGNRVEYGYFSKDNLPNRKCEAHKMIFYSDFDNVISAPYIERQITEGLYIVDEEYNYKNLLGAIGFDNEE